ncbi:tenascin-X-like [Bufo gargarizans]|uniref:tenascin-X-like n=1 Tax=Bufo gargarizans TaxID=30331 RepID=UPI001CF2B60E|nr:tenascin-X-like [Bufo gargarizans]
MSVKSLQISNTTSSSVSLTWSTPDGNQTSYSYRIQTNLTSSSVMINDTIVGSESATIMNLTAGETYTFMVYTRAADDITESDLVSLTTCTVPGQVSSLSLTNYKSVDFLGATWTKSAGKVDNYTVSLTGAVNKTIPASTTQVNFTGLLPGRAYTVTVQTVSGSCSQTSAPVTEATYPTSPANFASNAVDTTNLTLSWSEPINMSDVNKSYNISYGNSSATWTSTSTTTSVTLQNLTSGTNYSITVVTVGVRGYQSSPVSTSVYTKPMSVNSLQISNVTSSSVSLTWSKPDEYQTSYSYRVQTNVTSSSVMINDTIVRSESATIMNLTAGETYTFMVYTRAADDITESDPVSLSTCTAPGQVSSLSLSNYKSVDFLGATWTKSAGKVDNYTVSLTGAVNKTITTSTTQVNFTGLLPDREYTVTVQTVSGSCSQMSAPVTEATCEYHQDLLNGPTQPGKLSFISIRTKNLTLSWTEAVNINGVTKSYNISYGMFPSTNITVTSNATNVTLQKLTSGTNYSITVVTVGVRGYPSSPVSTSVYTKPMSVNSPQISNVTSSSVSLTWSKPDEYQTSYSYRVQTNLTSSSVMINDTIVRSESATIMNLTAGETYTIMVYTRATDDITESDPVSLTICIVPGQVSSLSLNNYKSVDFLGATWTKPAGKVDNYTVSLTGAVNKTIPASTTQVNFTGLLPGSEYTVTVQTVSETCSQMSAPVTEATYPTQPGKLSLISIETKNLTLSWTEPVNMTGLTKSYNISYGMFPSTNITVTSNATNVTLQNLTSGTNYSITVVTVGVRGYPSSPVRTSVQTKPMSVNSLQISDVTSSSVSLTWSKPDEYQTSYSYRVQTNLTSSSVMINDTIVRNESATIMNLTAGETYKFMVYTRAADGITESKPASQSTCTTPEKVSSLSLNNYKSVDFLGATWNKPEGKVDNYTVSLTGAVNKTIPTITTQVNFTGLLPGRDYTVTVQTVSENCSQMSFPVTEATYPTQPGKLSLISIETKNLTLSWTEPVNMTGLTKSYNISYGMFPSTNITVTSNATNVTLQNLTSGTNYSITVVTVGVRGYPSSPVRTSVQTKPMSVNSLQISDVTSSSVSLTWSKPDEYQTSYSYRVQTNLTSSSVMINDTIVRNESATIMNLTAGETYKFMVYTRAADGITESKPASQSTCTTPGKVSSLSLNNYKSVDFLGATWNKPEGKVDNYTVSLTGAVNKTIPTITTQVNFTGLLPGRDYTVNVQTVSENCSQMSFPVTEATYPTQPGKLSLISIETKNLTLSWTEPVNMSGVTKSYNISYGMFPSTNITVTSNATNVTLQNLTSGTNYSITVVTVGVRGYPSSPVRTSVQTKPMSVNSLQISDVTSSSVSLTWSKPDEYQTSYSYRVQTNLTSPSVMINDTIVRSESATIMNLTAGETYKFMVYTRAADGITESKPASQSTCTTPEKVSSLSLNNYKSVDFLGATWNKPEGKVDNYTVRLTGAVNKTIPTITTQVNFTGLLPGRDYTVTVQTVSENFSQMSFPVTEATCEYDQDLLNDPTQPGKLSLISIETKNLTLSWTEPVNMTGLTKSYNISYGMFPSTNITVTSNATNVTLQNLTSGTNYSITVVTVGVRGYPSSPVRTSVQTKPMSVNSLQISDVTSSSVSLTWSKPDEYQTSYSYRVQTNLTSPSEMINDTIVRSESATIMNLTAGETYKFMVYTRAADGITESKPASQSTCTTPEKVSSLSLNNYKSVDFLGATWNKPEGKVDNYTVRLTGAVNKTIPIITTQVNFTGLLPGRDYTVTVQTVSENCSQMSFPVTEATYPTQPGKLSLISIETKNLTLSWTEPVNMTGLTKSYNISYGMFPSTNITVTSNATNVTLQNLTSGTNYSITVVTVGVRGYPSSPVRTSVQTKPMSVNSLQISDVTSSSVSLTWSKPDEYQTSYSYRVQTNVTSPSEMINDTIVRSESATIMNLTAGETYKFMVYTRAADGITESKPASQSTCTTPEKVSSLSLNNYKSVDFLGATWNKPEGKVDNYTVSLTGAVNKTIPTITTQVNFTGLLPGRDYTVTVQTVSENCSQMSFPVTEATYSTQPGKLSLISIETKNLTLSWTEPVNMTGLTKSYNISYGMFPSTNITVTSNATNVTLQNLTSGTNYSITVVTVGVRGYPSSPVRTSVQTKPMSVNSLQISDVTSSSVSLTWSKPDEYQTSYSYRVQTNVTSPSEMINDTIVRSESATIMNLTAGETYKFMVYTRAADGITESKPASQSTCTTPEKVSSLSLNNYKSVDFLGATWNKPEGKVDNYTVHLTGAVNKTIPIITTQVNFTGLLPGRDYTVTVQTVSGSCSQMSFPVTEATYPTQPGKLSLISIETKNLTLSWTEPVNMTGLTKSYNISYGMFPSTNITVTSNATNVTLQNLTSGTNYSITVVTVGVRGYPSSPVRTSVQTKPMSVNSLQISDVTSSSVSLTWSKPDEYQTSYSYRVQTNVTSPSEMINDTIVRNESATIMNLTAGETYKFMVYTRAADGITESKPASQSTCTTPGQVSSLSLNNYKSVDFLGATWNKPEGKVDNYTVSLTGAVNKTIPTITTQVNFTGLLPGRDYTVNVQTVSENCSQMSFPVTEATYPTQPGKLSLISIETKNLTLSWTEPVNMSGVTKSYNISYGMFPSTNITVTSNATNVTLQNLTSGTNYSITVVTVGVRGYPSSPVRTSVQTKPMSVNSLQIGDVTSSSVSLTWSKPDEYQTSYSYRVQTHLTSPSEMINDTIVRSESATIMNLTAGETYKFMVYTRAADGITESKPASQSTCTTPGQVSSLSLNNYKSVDFLGATWKKPEGKVDNYTVSLTGAVNKTIPTITTQVNFIGLLPGREYTVTVQTVSENCSQMSFPVTEATCEYDQDLLNDPTQPGKLSLISIETKNLTLSWTEPVYMTGVTKSYNISYGMFPSTNITVTSNATNVTLQNLKSGTNYIITVVTVGVRGFGKQSFPASLLSRGARLVSDSLTAQPPHRSKGGARVAQFPCFPPAKGSPKAARMQDPSAIPDSCHSGASCRGGDPAGTRDPAGPLREGEEKRMKMGPDLSSYRPVALTSHLMKTFKRLVLNHLRPLVRSSLDPLQFAYQPGIRLDDAIIYLLHRALTYLERPRSTVRIMFLYFSSAFTTIQPGLPRDKLEMAGVDHHMSHWILDYLTEHPQFVKSQGCVSDKLICSTEAPQGTVLAPFLFTLYTADFSINSPGCHLQKLSDDSAIVSLITGEDDLEYRQGTQDYVDWCQWNQLQINAGKTKELLVDFRRHRPSALVPVNIQGRDIEVVDSYKYLEPMSVNSLQISDVTSSSVSLTWSKPDEYQTSYSYRVQTNVTSSVSINDTSVKNDTIGRNESATIMNLTAGETYTFMVYTRAADDITESDLVSQSTCTVPEAAEDFICAGQLNSSSLIVTWTCPGGLYTNFTFIATNNNNSVHNDVNTAACSPIQQTYIMQGLSFNTIYSVSLTTGSSCGKSSRVVQKNCLTGIGSPSNQNIVVAKSNNPTYYSFPLTFDEFDSKNGTIKAYALIVSSVNGDGPSANDLVKTYSDFKSKSTNAYVAYIIKDEKLQRLSRAATRTATIGDGSGELQPYQNGPLEPASSYWVGVAGFTSYVVDESGRIMPSKCLFAISNYYGPFQTTVNQGMIAGAVVGTILGVLAIGLIAFFIWKMRRKGEKKPDVSMLPSFKFSHAMSTASFISHFERQKADSNLGFSEEYEKLAHVGVEQTKLAADNSENRQKNRYTNVLPYDVSRVVLSSAENLSEDYINANYIPGYSSPKEFIAAQGPLPKTVSDFWRMIWEKDVKAIVMLTKCVELGKVKCEEYWPQKSSKVYGNLSVSIADENILPDWTTRDFILVNEQSRQSKKVRHFHFTAWPDHGVPRTTSDLIQFRNLVREYTANCYPVNSPILVHCSAGVGRTGTFIGLDRIIKQIETEARIDVYGIVYDLRMHRVLMVQTESQYIFLNRCALDIIKAQKETDTDLIYRNTSAIYDTVSP